MSDQKVLDYNGNAAPDNYICSKCQIAGVKLWRQYQTMACYVELMCADCSVKDQKTEERVDDDGRIRSVMKLDDGRVFDMGKSDQIGWLVPAVPTEENDTYWGYTSVPQPGVDWWHRLPTRRKKRVAIFGMAANPIHNGHIATAEAVAKHFDEVWLLPCYSHMYDKKMTSAKHRLAMCKLAVEGHSKIKVSSFEIDNKLTDGTYDMLQRISGFYLNDICFSFVIGQDNADTIEKWKNHEKLIQEYSFVVVPRKEYKTAEDWFNKSPHLYLIDADIPRVSSTEIREYVRLHPQAEIFLDSQLHQDVLKYIFKHKLYEK